MNLNQILDDPEQVAHIRRWRDGQVAEELEQISQFDDGELRAELVRRIALLRKVLPNGK